MYGNEKKEQNLALNIFMTLRKVRPLHVSGVTKIHSARVGSLVCTILQIDYRVTSS